MGAQWILAFSAFDCIILRGIGLIVHDLCVALIDNLCQPKCLSVHQRLKRVNIAQNAHNTIDKPCANEKQGRGGKGRGELGSGVKP